MYLRLCLALVLLAGLTGCVINSQKPIPNQNSTTVTQSPTTPSTPAPSCALTYTAQLVDPTGRNEFSKRAFILLETGTTIAGSKVTRYRTNSSMIPLDSGAISWCVLAPAPSDWILVVTISDGAGNLYPSTVIPHPVSGETITVGGTTMAAASAPPTTLAGTVTSLPIGTNWHAYPLTAIADPVDPTRTLEIVMPAMNGMVAGVKSVDFGGALGYTVGSPSCYPALYCQQYTVELPSQSPFIRAANGYIQAAAAPAYGVGLVPQGLAGGVNCTPAEADTWFQLDGSPMIAVPGVTLHPATLSVTNCLGA